MLLEVNDMDVRYGRVHAVRGVSLKVDAGEIVAVLGANGAGKSSLLKALMGLEPVAGGRVTFDGEDMTRWPPGRRVRRNLALVPEGRRIIMSLTVHENLLMGAFVRHDCAKSRPNRRYLRMVSESRRAAASAGVSAIGWRTADARDRPWPAVEPATDDAGRAVAGLKPATHQRGVRADRADQSHAGARDSAGRTEHAQGAGAGQPRLCA